MKPFSLLSCFILVSVGLLVDLHAAATTTTTPNAGYALVEQIIRSCGDEKTFDPSLKNESFNSAEIIIAVARLCPAFAEIFPDQLAAATAPAAPAAPAAPTTPAAAVAHNTFDDRRVLLASSAACDNQDDDRWVIAGFTAFGGSVSGGIFGALAGAAVGGVTTLAMLVLQVITFVVDLFVSDVLPLGKASPSGLAGGVACGVCAFVLS